MLTEDCSLQKFLTALVLVLPLLAQDVFASRTCSGAHTEISHIHLWSIFRRDWMMSKLERHGLTAWRVSPRSARRIQGFVERTIRDPWNFEGEALLIYRNGRVHSALMWAYSEKFGSALVLLKADGRSTTEVQSLLEEVVSVTSRPVFEYTLQEPVGRL